jgi:hypothetical protein
MTAPTKYREDTRHLAEAARDESFLRWRDGNGGLGPMTYRTAPDYVREAFHARDASFAAWVAEQRREEDERIAAEQQKPEVERQKIVRESFASTFEAASSEHRARYFMGHRVALRPPQPVLDTHPVRQPRNVRDSEHPDGVLLPRRRGRT